MPIATSALLRELWRGMPEEVRLSERITRDGLPVKNLRIGYLFDVLQQASVALKQSDIKTDRGILDDAQADQIRDALSENALSHAKILNYARWMQTLDQVRVRDRVDTETLHRRARILANTREDLQQADASERRRIAHEHLQTLEEDQHLSTRKLDSYLNRQGVQKELEQRLAKLWMAQPEVHRDSALQLGPYRQLMTRQRLTGSFRDEGLSAASPAWESILRKDDGLLRADAARFWLTWDEEPPYPRIVGDSLDDSWNSYGGPGSFPLDLSLRERFGRLQVGQGSSLDVARSPEEALTIMIEGAVQPLGLPVAWARKMMVWGLAVSSLLLWKLGPLPQNLKSIEKLRYELLDEAGIVAAEPLVPGEEPGGEAYKIARDWMFRIHKIRDGGGVVLKEGATSLFENPSSYYMGRLWTRVLRCCLNSSEEPTVADAWYEVHGAFVSLYREVGKQSVQITSDEEIAKKRVTAGQTLAPVFLFSRRALPQRSLFDDVLRTAIDLQGPEKVGAFWVNLVNTSSYPTPEPRREPEPEREPEPTLKSALHPEPSWNTLYAELERTWQEFVRLEQQEHQLSSTDVSVELDIPFEHLRRWAFRITAGIGEEAQELDLNSFGQ